MFRPLSIFKCFWGHLFDEITVSFYIPLENLFVFLAGCRFSLRSNLQLYVVRKSGWSLGRYSGWYSWRYPGWYLERSVSPIPSHPCERSRSCWLSDTFRWCDCWNIWILYWIYLLLVYGSVIAMVAVVDAFNCRLETLTFDGILYLSLVRYSVLVLCIFAFKGQLFFLFIVVDRKDFWCFGLFKSHHGQEVILISWMDC